MPPAVDKSDAYHEAGHIVIGVVQDFTLKSATAVETAPMFPHTAWENYGNADNPEALTKRYALMCLAAEFAEALVADVNNLQSKLAIHCDYLDAEVKRKNSRLDYFGLIGKEHLRQEAKALVDQHKEAIGRVADALIAGEVLTHKRVESLIAKPKE